MVCTCNYVTCIEIGGVGHAHWRTGTGPADWTPTPLKLDGGIRTAEKEQFADKFSSPQAVDESGRVSEDSPNVI